MGDAISMEDAISMLTIIFVLFVIFLVPLISIDKAKLEQAKEDFLWQQVIDNWHNRTPALDNDLSKYIGAFGLEYHLLAQKTTIVDDGHHTHYEFLDEDSSLVVVTHMRSTKNFSLMRMSSHGGSTIFRHGQLGWSSSANEWFITKEENDYGDSEQSKELLTRYRSWYAQKADNE